MGLQRALLQAAVAAGSLSCWGRRLHEPGVVEGHQQSRCAQKPPVPVGAAAPASTATQGSRNLFTTHLSAASQLTACTRTLLGRVRVSLLVFSSSLLGSVHPASTREFFKMLGRGNSCPGTNIRISEELHMPGPTRFGTRICDINKSDHQ